MTSAAVLCRPDYFLSSVLCFFCHHLTSSFFILAAYT
jgi:hypothetical protein